MANSEKEKDLCAEEEVEKTAENGAEKEKPKKKSPKKSDKKADELAKKLEEAEKKYNELDDKYFRLAAEYTNYQRRTSEEKDALYTSAVADTVEKLLPILDNIDRAITTAEQADNMEAVTEGIKKIAKDAADTFKKMGIEPIEAVGQSFDAAYHNAVMHVDDDSVGENIVVEEFMKGYKKGDKVIRYSMVKVAN